MQGWLRSEPELDEFWQMYCQERPGPPKVDFERHTAVYFFHGPPAQGWAIRIDSVSDTSPPLIAITRLDKTECPNFGVQVAGFLFLIRRIEQQPVFEITEEIGCRT